MLLCQVYVKPEWEHLNGSNGTTDFTMSLAQVFELLWKCNLLVCPCHQGTRTAGVAAACPDVWMMGWQHGGKTSLENCRHPGLAAAASSSPSEARRNVCLLQSAHGPQPDLKVAGLVPGEQMEKLKAEDEPRTSTLGKPGPSRMH